MRQENFDTTKNRGILDNESSEFVSACTGIDFGAVSSDTNGKGVYMRAGTENDAYPILYYRGAVEDNNVIFNNKCWKAVRTTDTGGVKLIYNGETGPVYIAGDAYSNSSYTILESNLFTFNETTKTWDVEMNNSNGTEIEFMVPSGDNYSFVLTGTSSQRGSISVTIYKDGVSVNGTGGAGGGPVSLTYNYGTLNSDNIVRMVVTGGGAEGYPATLHVKMQRNGVDLNKNEYTLGSHISFNYNADAKTYSSSLSSKGDYSIIQFNVNEAGNYYLNYNNPGNGTFEVSKDGTPILAKASGENLVALRNLTNSNIIKVKYYHIGTTAHSVSFSLNESQNTGVTGCDNTGTDTQITLNGTGSFQFSGNNLNNSPAYVGYMWGTVYPYSNSNWTSNAKFGSSFTWDGTNYKLVDATVTTPNDTHHYSCNSTDAEATCASIRYVYWLNESINLKYYITISDGKGIEEAIEDMQTNTNPSNAKTQIDSWYASNMNTVTNKLEDTIWCNDRSIGRYNGWSATGTINGSSDYKNYSLLFGAHERSNYASGTSTTKNQPSLACVNKNDAFTVNNGNGNQKLQYPVALLTEDEIVLAGGLAGTQNTSFYLNNGNIFYWSLSPSNFSDSGDAREFRVRNGDINYSSVNAPIGLRPSVSLKPGTPVIRGDGTILSPYLIS